MMDCFYQQKSVQCIQLHR